MRKGLSVKTKISFAVLLISIACSILIGSSCYTLLKNNLELYMGNKARDIALTVSLNIDGDKIAQYDKTGLKDSYFTELTDYLSAVKASTNMTYLYIMTDAGDDYKYITEGGENPIELGDTQSKSEYGPEPLTVLNTGQAAFTKMYDNGEYGQLLSGFAPIKNAAGNVTGLVGLDFGTSIIATSLNDFLPTTVIIMLISCLLSYLLIFFVVSRIVVKPLKMLDSASRHLADCDFSIAISPKYLRKKDEIGRLANALNDLAQNTNRLIGDISVTLREMSSKNLDVATDEAYTGDFVPIKESIDSIIGTYNVLLADFRTAAESVSSSSQSLSEIANELANGSVVQSSVIEQLTSSIIHIAENAEQNAQRVTNAKEYICDMDSNIMRSNDYMSKLLEAMEEISTTSTHITKFNKVIDDITFQTNILALNAAVEAARAGTAGKGFSVVAKEIRGLANKTADASKQTSSLVSASLKAVKKGIMITEQTAAALDDVLKKIRLVTDTIEDIAQVSDVQANAMTEIKIGMHQISGVVITDSAKAQQSAASSEVLSSQSQHLYHDIADFTLKSVDAEPFDDCMAMQLGA